MSVRFGTSFRPDITKTPKRRITLCMQRLYKCYIRNVYEHFVASGQLDLPLV